MRSLRMVWNVLSCDSASQTSVLCRLRVTFQPPLPLAMYYELAAHLGQLPGITTNLLWQESLTFNYKDSQITAIAIQSDQVLEQDLLKATGDDLKQGWKINLGSNLSDIKVVTRLVGLVLSFYGNWQIDLQSEAEL